MMGSWLTLGLSALALLHSVSQLFIDFISWDPRQMASDNVGLAVVRLRGRGREKPTDSLCLRLCFWQSCTSLGPQLLPGGPVGIPVPALAPLRYHRLLWILQTKCGSGFLLCCFTILWDFLALPLTTYVTSSLH